MNCGIIGDSIALGLALISSCEYKATRGISTQVIAARQLPNCYDVGVISAGSNDRASYGRTTANLYKIRRKLCAKKVVWILPAHNSYKVKSVAAALGDRTVYFKAGRDGVHPTSYFKLKRKVF